MSGEGTVAALFAEPGFLRPDQHGVDFFGQRFAGYLYRWPPAGVDSVEPPRGDDFKRLHRHREFVAPYPGGIPVDMNVGVLHFGTVDVRASFELDAAETQRHYAEHAPRVGVLRAGENRVGLWVTGLLDAPPPPRAHWGLWGHWHTVDGRLTLVAVVATDQPEAIVSVRVIADEDGVG